MPRCASRGRVDMRIKWKQGDGQRSTADRCVSISSIAVDPQSVINERIKTPKNPGFVEMQIEKFIVTRDAGDV